MIKILYVNLSAKVGLINPLPLILDLWPTKRTRNHVISRYIPLNQSNIVIYSFYILQKREWIMELF